MIAYSVSIQYMLAGYSVTFVVLALYVVSLFIRWKNSKRDLRMLAEIQKKP